MLSVEQGTKWLCSSVFLLFVLGIRQWISCSTAELTCGHPAVPLNAEVTLNSTSLTAWTTASYKCKEGYELFGSFLLTCQPNGQWKGDLPFCGTNVAYRRPANQSTTVRGGSAQNANGGIGGADQENKCSETQKEASPWWRVDLLKPYAIKVVRVTTKGCCGHQPLQDMEIRVGNSSDQLQRNPLCAWFPGTIDEGVTKDFTCARALIGQYVFLQLVGVDGSLSLCDVQVFSPDELSIDDCSPKGAPDTIDLAPFNRTCYEFGVSQGKSFKEARQYCKKFNGDLVHGMDFSITHFLHSELERRKNALKTQLVWIGAEKEPGATSTNWKWINGHPIFSPAWGAEQPNNYNGEQNCVVLDGGRKWLWNDVGCNLDYLHWICQYSPSSCGNPNKNLNTTIIGTNFEKDSVIKYQCPEGHVLLGDEKRKCLNKGIWSGSAPSCKYVNCEALPDIEHGAVILQDQRTTFGARGMYSCHNNYTLVGSEVRTCGEDGKWTDSTPKCLFNWCPEPPDVDGAVKLASGNKAGSTATYVCQPGYITIGKSTLTCDFGGKWLGKLPSCKYVDCGFPANIQEGNYQLLNGTTFVNSVVEYSCNEDFWLDGEKLQKCTTEGKWSGDTPSCEVITCEEPEVPLGSTVVGYDHDFHIHSVIEYRCDPGHILRGKSSFTCLKNGEWSGSTPVCDFINCEKVPPIPYGEVSYVNGTTYFSSEIRYKCSKGYRINGVSSRQCLESKQWSGASPKCEEIRCPEPILANHSILSVTGNDRMYGRTLIKTSDSNSASASTYKIGALVKYRCERGFKIVGESLSTCEESGQWSGAVPQCIFVDCKTPPSLLNGKVTLASNATYYGAIALYSCEPKYELDGVSRRICLENGTWSLESPNCKEIRCNQPETQNGALFTVDYYTIGGTVQYSCPRGHKLIGNMTRMCLASGKWSGRPPLCSAVECTEPSKIDNGHVIVANGTTYNSAIEYHCVPGFKRVGPYLRKCLEDGKWSLDEPKCEVAEEEPQDSSGLGRNVGIGAGVVLVLLLALGLVYLKLRKPVPVKNTENVESAERKDDRNASVVSYASLSDRNGAMRYPSMYGNYDENMYNAPYEETRRGSGSYEPEPDVSNFVTINGVAVR